MPSTGQPVIIKNKIVYGYMDKATVCRDMGRADYNDLTEAQQLNGDVYFIQGVDASAFAPTNSLWNKVGTTPLDSELPADCSNAINQLKSNLTQLGTPITASWIEGNYSADGSQLTTNMTLTAGTYIIIVGLPVFNAQKLIYFYDGALVPYTYINSPYAYNSKTFVYSCNSTKTCCIKLGQSGAMSVSYADRGYFVAIKIA